MFVAFDMVKLGEIGPDVVRRRIDPLWDPQGRILIDGHRRTSSTALSTKSTTTVVGSSDWTWSSELSRGAIHVGWPEGLRLGRRARASGSTGRL